MSFFCVLACKLAKHLLSSLSFWNSQSVAITFVDRSGVFATAEGTLKRGMLVVIICVYSMCLMLICLTEGSFFAEKNIRLGFLH
jgi:hypothetical protein